MTHAEPSGRSDVGRRGKARPVRSGPGADAGTLTLADRVLSQPGAGPPSARALLVAGGRVLGWPGADHVVIGDGRVVHIGRHPAPHDPMATLDASGLLIAPGFIDTQVNGAVSVDLTTDPERLGEVAGALPRYGVTSFVPTVITAGRDAPGRMLAVLAGYRAAAGSARPLGVHLEGPMLSPARRGVHPAGLLRLPSPGVIEGWSRAAGVALVTLAPELPGGIETVRRLVERGVTVAAGHTDATTDEIVAGIDAGVTHLTHMFNAMRPMHHRDPGPVGVALGYGGLTAGLIVDGHHLHPRTVAAAWCAMGRRINLVSDATALLGAADGRAVVGGVPVTRRAGAARTDDGVLAGSDTPIDQALRNLVAWTDCSVADAIATVTSSAAALLRRPDVGHLVPGGDADLVLLDDHLEVVATVIAGVIAYDRRRP